MIIDSITVAQLAVPLREPFEIATASVVETGAALVTARVSGPGRQRAYGYGEAATLVPLTWEQPDEVRAAIEHAAAGLRGCEVHDVEGVRLVVTQALPDRPAARAGLESALVDALARLNHLPLYRLLGGEAREPVPLETDITLSIADVDTMANNARSFWDKGFSHYKVKVGRDVKHDVAALEAIAKVAPDARVRIDANGGYSAKDALRTIERVQALPLTLECFEQPCARDDFAGMAEVAAASPVPIIADESVRTIGDVELVASRGAAHGVNLKLAKHGGPVMAVRVGRLARELGLRLMAGAMVETRLGIATMAHVVWALGGVDYVDLDTALLLKEDPFDGGYRDEGSLYFPLAGAGLALEPKGLDQRASGPPAR